MAFNVNFYNLTKQENSTLRPTGTPETFQCVIKHGSGLINPTLELDIGLTEAPAWNYCYIPAWRRWYYIREWHFDKAIWTASLKVDVLATYRAEIGNADLYALRTSVSSLYDGRIVDQLYPAKVNCSYDSTTMNTVWKTPANGCFVIGVVAKTPIYGSVNYYCVDRSAMQSIIQGLLDNTITEENGFNLSDAGAGLQLALVDPLQYIKSAVFLPVSYSDVSGVPVPLNQMVIFNYPVTISGNDKIIVNEPYFTISRTFNTIKHPQTASRGQFVNTSPYTLATLSFPPFGTIELDTTVICNVDSITVDVRIDTLNGRGIMEVWANGVLLNKLESQIGVPVQLSQVTRDYMGAFNNTVSAASSIAGGIGSILTGNIAGGVGSIIGGAGAIGNAGASLVPRSQSIGSGGSYAQLYENPRLDFQFFECVDDDIEKNGRPCCKVVKPGQNSGYYLIQDGDVPINGTNDEAKEIKSYLESGFYWE